MYKISEFAKMVGLPQSKVRFYEKNGLLKGNKDKSGYRNFTHHDAFRVNAFRVLLQYGFSVEKAIEMLDERQSCELFVNSLQFQRTELKREIELMNSRFKKLDMVISMLKEDFEDKFEITEIEEYLHVYASNGLDFSFSIKNAKIIAQFAELLSITSYARIIKKEDLLSEKEIITPSYAVAIPISKVSYLGNYDKSRVNRINMGKCIRYYRKKNREESARKDSFKRLFEFLEENNYEIRDDISILPTFLNLDGKGSDIEVLYVPIK